MVQIRRNSELNSIVCCRATGNQTDAHEKGLMEYVEDEKYGKFSRYIKRLIAQFRDGGARVYSATVMFELEENDLMSGYL
ncbi:hypothetical protein [Sporosarcina sp. E16_8]|uniref:hypothetical protein n=1 Tax=Sporosarcina sp. E16_8 TaxID=2789295 RepID=UPI001A9151B3|nr:hypothetical protein [Sporosarcina sp. E16_8]MBO0587464.1 hypothetical protein [Sporosarcina sp. E16_8]